MACPSTSGLRNLPQRKHSSFGSQREGGPQHADCESQSQCPPLQLQLLPGAGQDATEAAVAGAGFDFLFCFVVCFLLLLLLLSVAFLFKSFPMLLQEFISQN